MVKATVCIAQTYRFRPTSDRLHFSSLKTPTLMTHDKLPTDLVDGGVDDDPGATTQLAVGGDVDEDRVAVRPERVHDLGAELQDLWEKGGGRAGQAPARGVRCSSMLGPGREYASRPRSSPSSHPRPYIHRPPFILGSLSQLKPLITLRTSPNMSLVPPEKPRQFAKIRRGRFSPRLKSSMACAVLKAESGYHTCGHTDRGGGLGLGGGWSG